MARRGGGAKVINRNVGVELYIAGHFVCRPTVCLGFIELIVSYTFGVHSLTSVTL